MDFAKIAISKKPMEVEILHPTTFEPLVDEFENIAKFLVISKDHPDAQKAAEKIYEKTKKKLRKNPGKGLDLSFDEAKDQGLSLLLACIVGVENIVFDGEPVTNTPESLKALFEACPFVQDQIQAFIDDQANFIQAS